MTAGALESQSQIWDAWTSEQDPQEFLDMCEDGATASPASLRASVARYVAEYQSYCRETQQETDEQDAPGSSRVDLDVVTSALYDVIVEDCDPFGEPQA